MNATENTYAWCFVHGYVHTFSGKPWFWCTDSWVVMDADTEEAAHKEKLTRYGTARFLHELEDHDYLTIGITS